MKKILIPIVILLVGYMAYALAYSEQSNEVAEVKPTTKPNVLFIAIDDLRPELGCYGSEVAKTPNLDKLAETGIRFNRAYCQQAICGPSRASLMTGSRPESIGVIENYADFRELNPDIVTLPQHFKENGYETVYCGKIYHGKYTDPNHSWSRQPAEDQVGVPKPNLIGGYALPENQEIAQKRKAWAKATYAQYGKSAIYGLGRGPAYECADLPDHAYNDGYNTDLAIATMKDMLKKDSDKPFFLGLGFVRPHLEWLAPKKYWDMYDPEQIPLTDELDAPENGAAMGLHASFELRVRDGIPKSGKIDPKLSRKLKHAYLASVSYVDAQVGRMMKALEEAGQLDNTIVIVWSDHGWHLGDKGIWGKATNYEIATRVPLIISTPDMVAKNRGASSDALVELVDMYPTLCELAGLSTPKHLEGHSFVPLLENPKLDWKSAVFSQYPNPALREWAANPLSDGMRETFFGPLIKEVEGRIKTQQKEKWNRDFFENFLMGYSMRTDKYRMIVWKDRRDKEAEPVFVELFDHDTDPKETTNIAEANPEIVAQLMLKFKAGWKGNLPKQI